jgi:hypothetical protein
MIKSIFSIFLLLVATQVGAGDVYNPANGQLNIPSVQVGSTNYGNVVVTVGNIVSVGAPGGFNLGSTGNNIWSKMKNVVLTGYDNNTPQNQYQLKITFSPGANTTFEGQPASVINELIYIYQNGIMKGTSSQVNYFAVNDYRISLGYSADNNEYVVFGNQLFQPTSGLAIGSNGFKQTGLTYENSSKSNLLSILAVTVSLEPNPIGDNVQICPAVQPPNGAPSICTAAPNATANLCTYTYTTLITGKQSPTVTSTCFGVDTLGNLLGTISGIFNIGTSWIQMTGTF